MKSFLLKEKTPILKWGQLPDNVFFEGNLPEGYSLAICPSKGTIIIDVDKHGDINGFDNVPDNLKKELINTLHYSTKNNGAHYWFHYTGNKPLANKTSGKGIDLRTHKGYVRWYLKEDIRILLPKIQYSSKNMNKWLESLFSYN